VNKTTEYINLDMSDLLYQVICVVFIGSLVATIPIMVSLYISGLEKVIEENEIGESEENKIDSLLKEVDYEK